MISVSVSDVDDESMDCASERGIAKKESPILYLGEESAAGPGGWKRRRDRKGRHMKAWIWTEGRKMEDGGILKGEMER